MKKKVVIILLIVIFVIGFLLGGKCYKYMHKRNCTELELTVENFYNEPYFENQDVIESLCINYGIFEFMLKRETNSDREMIERYFHVLFPTEVSLVEYELLEDTEKEASDMTIGLPYRITAVVSGEQYAIDSMFNSEGRYQLNDKAIDIFNKYWNNKSDVNISEYCVEPSLYRYYNKFGKVVRGLRYAYFFFGTSKDGQQSVYMTVDGIGLSDEEGW